jgi:beta-glucosidase
MKYKILFLFGLILFVSCKKQEELIFVDINIPVQLTTSEREVAIKKQVSEIIGTMSQAEKIAQLQGAWLRDLLVEGKLSIEKCKELIPNGIGHLAQFSSSIGLEPEALRHVVSNLQDYQKNHTKSKIPAIFHEEAISGFSARGATTLPQQIGMGCTWNPELLKANTASSARLMRMVGATQALSPMLDICRDAHWGRIEESFGEDPYFISRMGHAFVTGLQGDNLKQGVAATTKHFAGYAGGTNDLKLFYEETLRPHEVTVRLAKAQSAMAGYHEVHGVPCSASKELLTDILRDNWGFDGVVVSDFWSVNQVFTKFKYGKDQKEAAVKSLQAGLDVELPKGAAFPFLGQAIEEGSLKQATLDQALTRVLTLKARLGLLGPDAQLVSKGSIDFDPKENRERAYQSAVQSTVLLKNDGVLPIGNNVKNIAVVGPNADAVQSLLGDYTYQSLSAYWWKLPTDPLNPKLVTLLEGLKHHVGEHIKVTYAKGCDWTKSLQSEIDEVDTTIGDARSKDVEFIKISDLKAPNLEEALKVASESDVIVAAMGEHLYLSGENRNRRDIRLPGEQQAFIKKLADTGKPVILVVFSGRPTVLTEIEADCNAIVQAWFPGEEGGNAVANILLGKENPSGKLTLTFPSSNEQTPLWYGEGYDSSNMPLYPFGHGLSYTAFEYSNMEMDASANILDEWMTISFDLKNTGDMDGTEVVQLYMSAKNVSGIINPIGLKGFTRVALKTGAQKKVVFKVSPEQVSYFENGSFVIEPAEYEFLIGASSIDIKLRKTVQLKGTKKGMKLKSKFFSNSVTQ